MYACVMLVQICIGVWVWREALARNQTLQGESLAPCLRYAYAPTCMYIHFCVTRVCICLYMYIICIDVYMCVSGGSVWEEIQMCTYINVYTLSMLMCVCISICIRVYVCKYVCMYVYIYIYIYIHTYTHTHTY